jgi:PQQ-dependent catabolism-associated CXXCW motif protein
MSGRLSPAVWLVSCLLAGGVCNAEGAGVEEPVAYRTGDYRSPVPATLNGAKVIDAGEAARVWREKTAVLIDVLPRPPKPESLPAGTIWRDPVRTSVPGSAWLPNVGYGVLAPAVEQYFASRLQSLTGGDKDRALVFFCERDCWMSWNAAKRALTLGYRNVSWFADGTDGWLEADLPLAAIQPVP